MIKGNQKLNFLLAGILFLLITACTQERNPCLQPVTAPLRAGCYYPVPVDTGFIHRDTLLPNAIFGAVDNDSLRFLYYGVKDISKFQLLMSPLHDSCVWLLQPDSGYVAIDTLIFYYERKRWFISAECGYSYHFILDRVKTTHHNIDSVLIQNNTIDLNANSGEHIQIFF